MTASVEAVSHDDLPDGWRRMKLKYIASLKSGAGITSDDISEAGPYPVYGGNGIRGYTSDYTHEGRHVVIGRQGALCGNINYADGYFWASEHAIIADILGDHDPTWLGELLHAMNLNQYSQSAAQPGLAVEFIANLDIPVPPLESQRAIAHFLDAETTRIDALIAAKENLLTILAEKRRALVTQAVTRGLDLSVPVRDSGIPWLGEIPAHWDVCHLRRILRSMDYGISTRVEQEGLVGVLRMGDIREGSVDYSRLGFVEDVPRNLLVADGDLLFNRTHSLDQIGKVGMVLGEYDGELSFASYLVRLRFGPGGFSPFFNWLLNSEYSAAWCRSEAIPAIGQANLNPTRYSYLKIPLPPMEEQKEIDSWLRGATEQIDAISGAARHTVELLRERREAVIAAAVTGQLDVGVA